jgi:hypothetical protein
MRGWRKGYARNDLPMWGMFQVSLLLPATVVVAGVASGQASLAQLASSPLLWLTPLVGLVPLMFRMHYLATRLGCTRQINVSEDGQPARCLIDCGHPECCKHIRPGAGKESCPYWKPQLVIE